MLTRSAGILIPLFSIRTRNSLGRGEIPDLAPMMDFALSMGHRVIQLLPLDETGPDDLSPYSAMSVMAIDPMYISVSGLAGVGRVVLGRARAAVGKARLCHARSYGGKNLHCSNAHTGRLARAADATKLRNSTRSSRPTRTGSATMRCFAPSRSASTGPVGKRGRRKLRSATPPHSQPRAANWPSRSRCTVIGSSSRTGSGRRCARTHPRTAR